MTINAAWHNRHRMPKNPTIDERIAWHTAHQSHCACRPIPGTLLPSVRRALAAPATPKRRAIRKARPRIATTPTC
jgi:hypothetical protein